MTYMQPINNVLYSIVPDLSLSARGNGTLQMTTSFANEGLHGNNRLTVYDSVPTTSFYSVGGASSDDQVTQVTYANPDEIDYARYRSLHTPAFLS